MGLLTLPIDKIKPADGRKLIMQITKTMAHEQALYRKIVTCTNLIIWLLAKWKKIIGAPIIAAWASNCCFSEDFQLLIGWSITHGDNATVADSVVYGSRFVATKFTVIAAKCFVEDIVRIIWDFLLFYFGFLLKWCTQSFFFFSEMEVRYYISVDSEMAKV
jgi:hypothetical protein